MLGVISGAHGVRGEVKVKPFTDSPRALGRYREFTDETGTHAIKLAVRGEARGLAIGRIEGVNDRDAAEALKGVKLYVTRDKLPKAKRGEVYIADLIGLAAVGLGGEAVGRVARVLNYGAGDVLEIERPGQEPLLLPFSDRMVPKIEVDAGRIVVDPPIEVEARGDDDDAVEEPGA